MFNFHVFIVPDLWSTMVVIGAKKTFMGIPRPRKYSTQNNKVRKFHNTKLSGSTVIDRHTLTGGAWPLAHSVSQLSCTTVFVRSSKKEYKWWPETWTLIEVALAKQIVQCYTCLLAATMPSFCYHLLSKATLYQSNATKIWFCKWCT